MSIATAISKTPRICYSPSVGNIFCQQENTVRRILLPIITICSGLLLAGCGLAQNPATPVLAIGAIPGKALATIWLSPTPVPLPSVSPEPSSTPAPTQPLPTLATPQATLPVGTLGAQASTPSDDSQNTPQAPSTSDCSTLPPQPFAQAWQNNQLAQQLLGLLGWLDSATHSRLPGLRTRLHALVPGRTEHLRPLH